MKTKKRTAYLICISVIFNQMLVHGTPLQDNAGAAIDKQKKILSTINEPTLDKEAEEAFEWLTKEGTDQWLTEIQKMKPDEDSGQAQQRDKRAESKAVSEKSKLLQQKLASLKGAASKAKSGITDLTKAYDSASSDTKKNINTMLTTTVNAIDKFTHAQSNPIGAVQASIDIVSSIVAFGGPAGSVLSMGMSFVSGILSLFGKAPGAEKPMSEVVREEIEKTLDKFYDKTLKNQAEGCIEAFHLSKAFLDGVASAVDGQIPDNAVSSVSAHVPVYHGLQFMGTLASATRDLIKKNSPAEGKKIMQYIELYCELATMKGLILLQLAALIPDSHISVRTGVLNVDNSLKHINKAMLKFLYSSDLDNVNIVSYYDPLLYPITDEYLQKLLKLKAPDRSMYGVYTIRNLFPGGYYHYYLSFDIKSPHPKVTVEQDDIVEWLLIPRGDNYFTIESLWGCPSGFEFCRAMLSWDFSSDYPTASIEHEDPIYWELKKSNNGYRVINKWDCPSNKFCNAELSYDGRSGTYPIATVQFSDPVDWEIKRIRDYTP